MQQIKEVRKHKVFSRVASIDGGSVVDTSCVVVLILVLLTISDLLGLTAYNSTTVPQSPTIIIGH